MSFERSRRALSTEKKIVSLAASSRELFQVENSLFGGYLEGSSGVAEWLRCGALVCITTEGSAVRIPPGAIFLLFVCFCFLSRPQGSGKTQGSVEARSLIKATRKRGP